MLDYDIRQALHATVLLEHARDRDTIIVPEMGILAGRARVDVAVVNGEINGIEIKSDGDSLARLNGQVDAYGKVFDQMTIIAAPKHGGDVARIVPRWWTILAATDRDGEVVLEKVRAGTTNEEQDNYAIAQLLWRNEALRLLDSLNLSNGIRTKPRRALWTRIAETLPKAMLKDCVRGILKARTTWRCDES
jgi:cobalamin biosynthesis Co2+ chelatase CbiK